jgi:hypothetical protein
MLKKEMYEMKISQDMKEEFNKDMENLQKNNQTEILKKHSLYQTKKYT